MSLPCLEDCYNKCSEGRHNQESLSSLNEGVCHITHSIEAGLSPREIQAQSGHRDIGTLMGYVQHTPERIRRSYERAFGDSEPVDNATLRQQIKPEISNEYWKKIATQKYLSGEIDIDMLHSILSTVEEKGTRRKIPTDPSYI